MTGIEALEVTELAIDVGGRAPRLAVWARFPARVADSSQEWRRLASSSPTGQRWPRIASRRGSVGIDARGGYGLTGCLERAEEEHPDGTLFGRSGDEPDRPPAAIHMEA